MQQRIRFFFLAATAVLSAHAHAQACPESAAGITLPPGFCATIFADGISHARHLVVSPSGVLYVNTWGGADQGKNTSTDRGFVVALQDTKGTGHADKAARFGDTAATGGAGGTGIALYKNRLFVEINDRIVRYELPAVGLKPIESPRTVVSGLPLGGDHPMHPFAIDADGKLFVNMGSASNACQEKNRQTGSPGRRPCKELETRGGIWQYDANTLDQKFSTAERFATGIRNAVGIAVDGSGHGLYSTQHGRDQLSQNWPALYTPEQGAKWPSEVLLRIKKGTDFGWPECYFDPAQGKLTLAPEYGGDGGKAVGNCALKQGPVAAFPGHWAPDALLFYQGTQFPERYRNGAFIAFHGSWNRFPFAQGGYNIVFQPLRAGAASGPCEIFADGFAGPVVAPSSALHRPTGLAMGPDGALFVSDDQRGRIYRITFVGGVDASAGAPTTCPAADADPIRTSDGTAATPAPRAGEILIPGDKIFPESLTSTADGTIYISGYGSHNIFKVKPGSQLADVWYPAESPTPQAVLGVLADDKTQTLWACMARAPSVDKATAPPSALNAFDLKSGRLRARYPLPSADAICNDIAIAASGTIYVTDTANMEIARLKKGASTLEVWAGGGAFGPKGGIIDGIAVLESSVYVNVLRTNKLFKVPVATDGSAQTITELRLSRPIDTPDGMRAWGKSSVLLAESGGAGRLSRVEFQGDKAAVTTLKEGFPDGPVSVTVIGTKAYVLEAQFKAMDSGAKTHPFHATAVDLR